MAEIIESGGITPNKLIIDEKGRANVYAVTETIVENAAENGDSFNINTGTINLTSANKSALLYLKNNGEEDIVISTIGYLIGNSTGGSGDLLAEVLRNPTSGTIVSGASNVEINVNKNFGSSQSLMVDAYKGAEANTFTDGEIAYKSLLSGAARGYVIATGSVVIPNGSSVGIELTPQTGNTSMDIQVFLSIIKYKND